MREPPSHIPPPPEALRAIAHAEWQRMPSRQSRVIIMGMLLEALTAEEQTLLPELENGRGPGFCDLNMAIEVMQAQYESYRRDGGAERDADIYKNLTQLFRQTASVLFAENIVFASDIGPARNIVRAALAFEEAAKPSKPERPHKGNVHALYKRSPFGLFMAANEVLSHSLSKIDQKWPGLIDTVCDQNSRVLYYRTFCDRNRSSYPLIKSLSDMDAQLITYFYQDMHDMVKDTAAFIKGATGKLPPATIGQNPHFRALLETGVFLQPYIQSPEPVMAEPRHNVVSIQTHRSKKGWDEFRF